IADHLVVELWERGAIVGEDARIRDYVARHPGLHPSLQFLGPSHSLLSQASALRRDLARSHVRLNSVGVIAPSWQAARVRLAFERSLHPTDVEVWSDGTPYRAARWW